MSTSATPSPSPTSAAPALSQMQRLVFTFTAPSRTMADISRSASWWLPWVVTALLSLLMVFTIDSKVGWNQVLQNQIEQNPGAAERLERMPAEQRAQVLGLQAKAVRILAYAGPATSLLYYVIVAGVLLAIFNFGFGAELKFAQAMAIAVYSSLVTSAKGLLIGIVLHAGLDPANFDLANPVASNPGYFMAPNTNRFLYNLVSAFDAFAIWMIVLMALGISRNSKIKTRTAFLAIFVSYFLYKVATGAIAAAF